MPRLPMTRRGALQAARAAALGQSRFERAGNIGADVRALCPAVFASLNDVYLLALAAQQDGRLVTLDRAVPLKAVPGSKARHLVVI